MIGLIGLIGLRVVVGSGSGRGGGERSGKGNVVVKVCKDDEFESQKMAKDD